MGLLWVFKGGAQESLTVLEEKDITKGLPGVEGTSISFGKSVTFK
jgi:hypothetical protein